MTGVDRTIDRWQHVSALLDLVSGAADSGRIALWAPSMQLQAKVLLSLAGVSLLAATVAGAVGSHALSFADESMLRSYETAARFQFFHGLGLIAITLVGLAGRGGKLRAISAWLFVVGTVLFCGSIYARTLGAAPGITRIAPYGGVALMLGWLAFAVSPWLTERKA